MRMLFAAILMLFLILVPSAGLAQCTTGEIVQGQQDNGAYYRIYMPDQQCWNQNLVLFSHGFVAPVLPVGIPEGHLVLPDGTNVPQMVNGLGFAFAVTSFSTNGLAVPEALADLEDLVAIFSERFGAPTKTYLNGVSQGGLITTLALEKYPHLYDGGVAVCGPVGDFRRQINYFGDFRVVFDYFFPGVIPGDAMDIPEEVMLNWESIYVPAIVGAIQSKPLATLQLLSVTNAAVGLDTQTVAETVLGVLWYNVFGTNDAAAKLGGLPFDNSNRHYRGSFNDRRLNRLIQRYTADPEALLTIEDHYQTSGDILGPLVTQHTLLDPIVPYWHEPLYRWKTLQEGTASLHTNLPILRYGHCNINAADTILSFGIMLLKGRRSRASFGCSEYAA